jgi:hypothetical protein
LSRKSATTFEELMRSQRSDLLQAWFKSALNTYPTDTAHFLKNQKDPFANPVGATLSRELELIFEELLKEQSSDQLVESVDAIIRIRAVQDFSPSQAVSLFLSFKEVLRSRLEPVVNERGWQRELREMENRVDELCLLAFDVYVKCREKIWELKANEARQRVSYILRKWDKQQSRKGESSEEVPKA